MSDAPERISLELRQGLSDDFWSECRDPRYAKSEPVAYVRADRIEAQEALLREAMGAFENAMGHLDTPISRRKIGIDPNEEWLLDARATLAKLRAHLGETE